MVKGLVKWMFAGWCFLFIFCVFRNVVLLKRLTEQKEKLQRTELALTKAQGQVVTILHQQVYSHTGSTVAFG